MQQLDDLDKGILNILIQNAKTPYAELAEKLFVSTGTIHVRIKKMEKMKVIIGSKIKVDYEKLGFDVCVFLGIYLEKSSFYEQVIKQLTNIPEVISAHYTTGAYSIFAQLICRDTSHLREVLHNNIQQIEGIQRTETFISLESCIERTAVI